MGGQRTLLGTRTEFAIVSLSIHSPGTIENGVEVSIKTQVKLYKTYFKNSL